VGDAPASTSFQVFSSLTGPPEADQCIGNLHPAPSAVAIATARTEAARDLIRELADLVIAFSVDSLEGDEFFASKGIV
jgi:hypothetical protein